MTLSAGMTSSFTVAFAITPFDVASTRLYNQPVGSEGKVSTAWGKERLQHQSCEGRSYGAFLPSGAAISILTQATIFSPYETSHKSLEIKLQLEQKLLYYKNNGTQTTRWLISVFLW